MCILSVIALFVYAEYLTTQLNIFTGSACRMTSSSLELRNTLLFIDGCGALIRLKHTGLCSHLGVIIRLGEGS